jgi:diguanylate cyclase (GGDEF)-like protein/PAS domain S-box-containing protein
MNDQTKTNQELLEENSFLNQRIQELEQSESERKRMEEALRESEEKYRNLFENANEAIFVAQDGKVAFLNPMAVVMIGYTNEELMAKPFIEFIHPDDRDMVIDRHVRRMKGEELPPIYSFRILHRDGHVRWAELNTILINWQGKPATLNFLSNITDRKQAEEALHLSEKNFHRSLDDSSLGVRIVTIKGETIYANRAMLNLYGYDSVDELKATPVKNRYTPQSYAEFKVRREKRKEDDDGPSEYEISIVRKNGEIRHLQVFRKELLWDGERQFQVIYQDITERKRAEEELSRMNAFLNSILENIPNMIFLKDARELRFIRFNRAGEDLLGHSMDDLLGKNDYDFFPKEQANFFTEKDREVLHGKEVVDIPEEPIQTRNKGERILHTKKVPILDAKGESAYLLGISEDITERKNAEEEKHRMEERSRKVVEDIFRFIPEGVLVFSRKMELLRQNQAFRELVSGYARRLGFAEDELENLIVDKIKAAMGDKNIKEIRISRKHETGEKKFDEFEELVLELDMARIIFAEEEEEEEEARIVVSIKDITERKRTEKALEESEKRYRELSIVDDLTSLYNSRHFYHQLKMETDRADRYGQPLTLLFLDLDDFKRFNDAYGHIEGDHVLLRLGQVVKRCLRQTDSAYRYGGEEFAILLPMTTSADGAVTAERIRTEFKKETFSPAPDQDGHVTVSIGLAQYKPQEEMKAFVHRVDQLMYQGKKNGKDRVCSEL